MGLARDPDWNISLELSIRREREEGLVDGSFHQADGFGHTCVVGENEQERECYSIKLGPEGHVLQQ